MSSIKVIDIFNNLHFTSDYNNNGIGSEVVTIDGYGILTLNSTQDSSNSSTGSLVIPNGSVAINANVNATAVDNGGTLTVGGGGAFSKDVYIGGNLNITGAIISNASVQGSNSFNYLTLTANDNAINSSTGSLVTLGGISIQAAGNATSITSGGGITITGGAAIGKDIYIGGIANLPNVISTNISSSNSNLDNITSSTLNVTGITSENVLITSSTVTNLLITNSLKATFNSNTVGSIFTTGGNVGINTTTPGYLLDINGNLRVNASSLNIISSSTLTDVLQIQNTNASGASTLQFLNNSGSSRASFGIGNNNAGQFQNTVYLSTVSGIPIQLSAGGNTSFPVIINASDNSLSITSTTASNSVSSGALNVSGGAGINGNLYVAGGLYVNSQLAATITNTTISSNSTTGAVLLSGGLSINILSTSNANATSYTYGGALTINGGAAISQNVYVYGILDIASGSNNLNNISLQSFQLYSNSGSGAYSVIGSGNSSRTAASFTPIRFTGWNDQSNPKLTINTNTIDIINAINATNNSNTIGNIFTTNGNVGINTTQPTFNLDVNGIARINTSLTSGAIYSTNITSTNIVATNSTLSTLNAGDLTTGNINFTGTLSQNGAPYFGSQWTTTGANISYTSGNVIVSNNISSSGLISTYGSIGSLSSANISLSGNMTVGGNLLVLGSLTSVNITSINVIDNNITAGTLNATNTTTVNIVSTNSSLGTINSIGLTTGNINFTGNLFQNGVAYVDSQWTTTAGLALSYTSGNVIVAGNVSSSGLISTAASIGNLSAGNMTLSGNITVGGNLLVLGILNVIDNNITAGTLNAGSATINNLTATNSSLGTINSTGLTTGNINFTGNLFQNGVSYIGSQWTTTSSNLSYTSGGVIVNDLTTGNLNFTGSIYQNGLLYSSSQWTSTAGSTISYTSGKVLITNENITNSSITTLNVTGLTAGNINFTGDLYQNGTPYIGTPYIGSQWTSTAANLSYTSGTVVMSNTSIGNLTVGNYLATNSTFSNLNVGNVNLGMTSSYSASFIAANNIATPTDVTGLIFSNTQIRYFEVTMTVNISYNSGANNYNGIYKLNGNYTDSGWNLYTAISGDDEYTSAITFTLNSSGQILYTSTNVANWTSTTFRFKVDQYSLNGTYTSLFSNTQGSYILGSMQINTTQDAIPNNNFGALQVLGGVTISKELFVGGTSFFNTAGSLGINTTNISSTLSISGGSILSSTADTPFLINNSFTAGAGSYSHTMKSINVNMDANEVVSYNIGQASDGKNEAYFGFGYVSSGSNNNYATIGLNAVDRILNINGNRNVGINTTAPIYTLDITGTSRISTRLDIGGTQPSFTSNTIGQLFLTGLSSNISGPHILINTSQDIYPTLHILNYAHDNMGLLFDNYWDGTFRTSSSNTAFQIYKEGNQLRFNYVTGTAGSTQTFTTAMVVGSTGNIGISQATPITALDINGQQYFSNTGNTNQPTQSTLGGTGTKIILYPGDGGTVPYALGVQNSNLWYSSFSGHMWYCNTTNPSMQLTNGNLLVTGNITDFASISDQRLKTNIQNISTTLALETIKNMRPVTFNWREDIFNKEHAGKSDSGFIAQEIEKLIPHAVLEYTDISGGENNHKIYKNLRHERLIPYLTAAIQALFDDQKLQQNTFEKKINELNLEINLLKQKLDI